MNEVTINGGAACRRSGIILANITGMRPSCFLGLGYALCAGTQVAHVAHGQKDSRRPFDLQTFAGLPWKTGGTVEERRRAFREHWEAVKNRPPRVPEESLIS